MPGFVELVPPTQDDEPGFDVVVMLVRRGSSQPPLYFRRIVPQQHTDKCRWQQINDNPYHAGTAGIARWSWEGIKELGDWQIFRREEKKVANDVPNSDGFEVGDIVDVRGEVVRQVPDKVLVKLSSNYSGPVERWFTNDQVTLVTKAVDADEPPPGALVEVIDENGYYRYYRRAGIDVTDRNRWHRQGGWAYSPITWRAVKGLGPWTRLYREGEV